jgi:hypothetical protein
MTNRNKATAITGAVADLSNDRSQSRRFHLPATAFMQAGGAIAIGSDSLSVSPAEDIRHLEYSQRTAT